MWRVSVQPGLRSEMCQCSWELSTLVRYVLIYPNEHHIFWEAQVWKFSQESSRYVYEIILGGLGRQGNPFMVTQLCLMVMVKSKVLFWYRLTYQIDQYALKSSHRN